tara:strand:- start:869 stop:1147 length:279 start_codon:yes stop_codon:yes gene_type:complete
MKLKMFKKGQVFNQLGALGVGIASLAITLVVVFLILSQTAANTTVAADANATAAVVTMQTSADDIPGWVPLVVIAVIGALLLSLVALFRRGA